jgi:hypothetical protein
VKLALVLSMFLLVPRAHADERVEAPRPKLEAPDVRGLYVAPVHQNLWPLRQPKPVFKTHAFYDRVGRIEFAVATGDTLVDTVQTCHNMGSPNWHEQFLPTQSCGKASLMLFGQLAAQELGALALHKLGAHKLERVVRFATVQANLRGVIHSIRNTR